MLSMPSAMTVNPNVGARATTDLIIAGFHGLQGVHGQKIDLFLPHQLEIDEGN
jgi:hypothetical protein